MPTTVLKTLDKRLAAAAAASHYTPTGTKQAAVKHISFTNQDTVARTVTGYRNGTAAGDVWLPTFSIDAGAHAEWEGLITLQGADLLAFASDLANKVLVVIDGAEITP